MSAQAPVQLRITGVDISDFPLVRLNLITADSQSTPLSDLSALSLRENGVPIADFEMTTVPVGMDVIFVIDANRSFAPESEAGLNRQEAVRESITRYANRFMSPVGLDRVSIVVPARNNRDGRFLVEDATTAEAVTAAVRSYDLQPVKDTPLNAMMTMALEHAARFQDEGRFQAVLLFTNGGNLDQQLNYEALVERAQAMNLSIFAAIVGGEATLNAIENVTRLSEPTRATYASMRRPADTDSIYLIWQRQGNQQQIEYRSLQTSSGRYPITLNLGEARASATLELDLRPPQVNVLEEMEEKVILRQGRTPDSPLTSLEPATQPVTVTVRWPDGLPRQLTDVSLFVDDQPQPIIELPRPDAQDRFVLNWSIRNLPDDTYDLTVQVTDELGLSAESEPVEVEIEIERPLPATPTAVPTAVPETVTRLPDIPLSRAQWLWAAGAAGLLALVFLWSQWRHTRTASGDGDWPEWSDPSLAAEATQPAPAPEGETLTVAYLEVMGESSEEVTLMPIEDDDVAIGRGKEASDIILTDKSVARLHARVKKSGGVYWLYDEGSARGTYLNFERVGLAPRPLQDRDRIDIGRVRLRFHLEHLPPAGEEEE